MSIMKCLVEKESGNGSHNGWFFARSQPPHEPLCPRLKPSLILITSDQLYRQACTTHNPMMTHVFSHPEFLSLVCMI